MCGLFVKIDDFRGEGFILYLVSSHNLLESSFEFFKV